MKKFILFYTLALSGTVKVKKVFLFFIKYVLYIFNTFGFTIWLSASKWSFQYFTWRLFILRVN